MSLISIENCRRPKECGLVESAEGAVREGIVDLTKVLATCSFCQLVGEGKRTPKGITIKMREPTMSENVKAQMMYIKYGLIMVYRHFFRNAS